VRLRSVLGRRQKPDDLLHHSVNGRPERGLHGTFDMRSNSNQPLGAGARKPLSPLELPPIALRLIPAKRFSQGRPRSWNVSMVARDPWGGRSARCTGHASLRNGNVISRAIAMNRGDWLGVDTRPRLSAFASFERG
jgi:hypothetical protein